MGDKPFHSQPPIPEQARYYDRRWADFTYANRLRLRRCTAILCELEKTNLYHPKIIDLGSGTGWLTGILGTFGPTTGVELSEVAVTDAQKRYPHVSFLAQDIFQWECPKEFYDVVVSQEVIEHVSDPEEYLRIAYDLLKTKGVLILTTPNRNTFYAMPERMRRDWSDQPLETLLSVEEVKRLLGKRFHSPKVTTIIPGYGTSGTYFFANSRRLRALIATITGEMMYDSLRQRLGYGLHTLAVAKK